VVRGPLWIVLCPAHDLGRLTTRAHAPHDAVQQGFLDRAHTVGPNLRERLLEAHQKALLELRRAELVARPTELLRNQNLHVESLPASRVEEVVADPLALEEGIGAVHGPLDHVRGLLGAEAPSLQLFGSCWNLEANGKDA